MRELQLEALAGTLGDFAAELAEYDDLNNATLIEATGIGEFPTALIRARIARGLTQRELAERLGLAEQAIQRYEATDYLGVSFSRLVESRRHWTSPFTTTCGSSTQADRKHAVSGRHVMRPSAVPRSLRADRSKSAHSCRCGSG